MLLILKITKFTIPFAENLCSYIYSLSGSFCGSKNGNNPLFTEHTVQLRKIIGQTWHYDLLYGGGNVGIMGKLADAVMEHGGKVTGVIPQVLVEWERQHNWHF